MVETSLLRRLGAPADDQLPDRLVRWRRRALERAGCDPADAATWAQLRGLDLHVMLTLIDRGCPPALAARIVAPIENAGD